MELELWRHIDEALRYGHGRWLLALAVLMLPLLLRYQREARATLLNTYGFFLFAMAGQVFAGLLAAFGYLQAAAALKELFLVAMGLAVIRLGGILIFQVVLPRLRLHPSSILEDMLVIVGYLVWGMSRLHEHGVELSSLITTSAVITAVIAFSMQDTLGNILGGIALQLDDSLKTGDWIKVNDATGKVVDIRWRSTIIETRNWETVVIPNSALMKTQFQVLGRRGGQPEQWRRWIWFNIDFLVPPHRVITAVEEALRRAQIANVASSPAPNCVMMDFGDSTARYALRYWLTDLAVDDPTDSQVRLHIYAALKRAGIDPAVPSQSLHLHKEGEKRDQQRHEKHIGQRVALLRRAEIFASLTDAELELLAERLRYAPFADGDVITGQGAVAHWLYLLAEGHAGVVIESASGRSRVGQIDAEGDSNFFGEMGMLTGEPRTATVVAEGQVLCYLLDKEAFTDVLHARPAIAEELAATMAERRSRLEVALQDMDEAQRRALHERNRSELLEGIRRFFGL